MKNKRLNLFISLYCSYLFIFYFFVKHGSLTQCLEPGLTAIWNHWSLCFLVSSFSQSRFRRMNAFLNLSFFELSVLLINFPSSFFANFDNTLLHALMISHHWICVNTHTENLITTSFQVFLPSYLRQLIHSRNVPIL